MPYGIYLVTSENNNINAGCIINTAAQITDTPTILTMSINKNSHTAKTILNSKKCIIGMISEKANMNLIEHFSATSGNTDDKFKKDYLDKINYEKNNDIVYLKNDMVCNLVCNVKEIIDCDSHYLFILNLTETIETNKNDNLMTYEIYRNLKNNKKDSYTCTVCHYVYDGDIPFDKLPDDYICPICGRGKDVFIKV